ncbi:MAG: hypothetical protein H6684_05870 [Deltaproteobacteria bacterium]|nr:hypothetical protein [bacterium]MCB9477918.1 hypothetical protein [Deltaproteobacteria bacterium]MCB9478723.1 hypothetical protein [Deltaproteobacteria bacterium]MCB9488239.1 hypothetical protein [Deltaproteobacteria bacterium]
MAAADSGSMIRGKLSRAVHPAKLLAGFLEAKKSGVLHFKDGASETTLYLKEGCLVFDPEAVFGDPSFFWHLTAKNNITRKEAGKYEQRAEEKRENPVELLIDAQLVSENAAREHAKSFYDRNVAGLFSWKQGDYIFDEKDLDFEDEPDPKGTLLTYLSGVIEKYDPLYVRERLKKRMDSPLKFNPKSRLSHEPFEGHTVASTLFTEMKKDPGRPLGKLLDDLKDINHELIGVIYGLLTMGVLRFGLTEQRKRKVVERRRAAKAANDPFQKLFAEASASLDRIHEEAQRRQTSGGAAAEGDEAAQLRARLDRLMAAKKEQREILERQMGDTGGPGLEDDLSFADGDDFGFDENSEAGFTDFDMTEDENAQGEEMETFFDEAAHTHAEDADEGRGAEFDTGFEGFGEFNTEDATQMDQPVDDFDGLSEYGIGGEAVATFSATDSNDSILASLKQAIDESRWDDANNAYNELENRGAESTEALCYGGWARYHAPVDDPFGAGASLVQKALMADNASDLPPLLLGKIYMAESDYGMAELYFVRAIEVNPDCFEAKELIKKLYEAR